MQTACSYAGYAFFLGLSFLYLIYHFIFAPKLQKKAGMTEPGDTPEVMPEDHESQGAQQQNPSTD